MQKRLTVTVAIFVKMHDLHISRLILAKCCICLLEQIHNELLYHLDDLIYYNVATIL
jgi:hypothetical protein